jgi:hypothetical protein
MAPGASEIGIHEMGHTAFGLADEYEYYEECGVDTNRDVHPGVEPAEPNVTIDNARATIKWRDLIDPATPMPTTMNADCTMCDPQASPVAAGTAGAFEGANYYHCGCYRPEFDCKMRALGFPFCAVCRRRIRATLAPFLPRYLVFELLDRIFDLRAYVNPRDWVVDPVPFDLARYQAVIRTPVPMSARLAADEFSDVVRGIERMDVGELRTRLLRVRSGIARLEAAGKILQAEIDRRGR